MKKFGLSIFIILLLISLYKDLTIGSTIDQNDVEKNDTNAPSPPKADVLEPPLRFNQKVPVKVKAGDTVLSIMENLHNGEYHFPIDEMLVDFKRLNPGIEPSAITIDKVYYFPLYENKHLEEN